MEAFPIPEPTADAPATRGHGGSPRPRHGAHPGLGRRTSGHRVTSGRRTPPHRTPSYEKAGLRLPRFFGFFSDAESTGRVSMAPVRRVPSSASTGRPVHREGQATNLTAEDLARLRSRDALSRPAAGRRQVPSALLVPARRRRRARSFGHAAWLARAWIEKRGDRCLRKQK
jgi:hypothetical protein